MRHPGAHHPGLFGYVNRGHPLQNLLVLLVLDLLRLHHRLARSSLIATGNTGRLPGGLGGIAEILTGVLKATMRDP